MDNKVVNILMFAAGAAIGSVVTWQFIKKKYEQIAQEEIDSVKEKFSNRMKEFGEGKKCTDDVEDDFDDTDKDAYAQIIKEQGYNSTEDLTEEVDNHAEKPYVIPPEEFGEYHGFETISYTYYADGVLADENDELIEDVEASVGFESLNHFGEYEDHSVYVRNEKTGCDYEILRDLRRYADVIKISHRTED